MNLLTGASLLALAKSIYYFLFKSCYFFYSFTNILIFFIVLQIFFLFVPRIIFNGTANCFTFG